jgi:hypothetical protein
MNNFLNTLGNWIRKVLPLGNNAKTMVVLGAFVAFLILCFALGKRAYGADVAEIGYIQVSSGAAVLRGPTSALNLAFALPSPFDRGDIIQTSATLIGSSTYMGVQAPNNYAFSMQYITGLKNFDIGIGPSWMENPYPYNGSRVNFNLMIGYRFQRWPVTVWWDHFSCGGACSPNYGRDLLLIGYRFKHD